MLFLTGFRADTPCPFFSRGRGVVGHKPVAKPSPVLQPLSSPVAFLNIPVLPEHSADLLHTWTNWNSFFPFKHNSQTGEETRTRIKLSCPQCFRPIQRENNLLPLSFLGERKFLGADAIIFAFLPAASRDFVLLFLKSLIVVLFPVRPFRSWEVWQHQRPSGFVAGELEASAYRKTGSSIPARLQAGL